MSNYVTAIGLDVHARSIKACALNPMTGEVERASFGYDPASVAEWALGFESPKAVYESGVTGFHLCRALRALGLDCAVGAVSKMQRPAADRGRKTDRRDAEFLARLLATRNVVEVWVPDERTEAARDLSRALADARVFVASKMLTKRHVAFEHFGRHVLHCFFALPSIKAASMRWLAPLNSTSLPWWTILSIMADASLSSPRTVPHFENSMFVVNIMLRLS